MTKLLDKSEWKYGPNLGHKTKMGLRTLKVS